MSVAGELPSWKPGATRDAIVDFVGRTETLPPLTKVAVFDNDGTLWAEKPNYTQLEFFLEELRRASVEDPSLLNRSEYAALVSGNREAISAFSLDEIALALMELLSGITPEEFSERARRFVIGEKHAGTERAYANTIYQPMLELLDCLRSHDFAVCVVTGGGTEFVRAVSHDLYGVEPERVVGTLVTYNYERRNGSPTLVRSMTPLGAANEGPEKVSNIQFHLGRRPIVAGGNSAGDTEMLEYAAASLDGGGLALLIEHDDGEREYEYASVAGTFAAAEPITVTAERLGWTIVSMKNDWTRVFANED